MAVLFIVSSVEGMGMGMEVETRAEQRQDGMITVVESERLIYLLISPLHEMKGALRCLPQTENEDLKCQMCATEQRRNTTLSRHAIQTSTNERALVHDDFMRLERYL